MEVAVADPRDIAILEEENSVQVRLVALTNALEKQGLSIEEEHIQSSKFCQAFVYGKTNNEITAEKVANNCCVRKFQFEHTGYQKELERLYKESKDLKLNKTSQEMIGEAKKIAFSNTPIPENSAWPWLSKTQKQARQATRKKKKSQPKPKPHVTNDGWTTVPVKR